MTLLDMGLQIIFVSVSGVLSPGPLFFANLVLSKNGGFWSGIKIAIGHRIVELPVIILYVSSVHGTAGIIGSLSIGIFASIVINPTGVNGLLYGNPQQLLIRAIGLGVGALLGFGELIILELGINTRLKEKTWQTLSPLSC